jgi:long-chain acyl-CoA synthetase
MTRDAVPEMTLPELVLEHARTHPAATALLQKQAGAWREITWAGFAARARNCAAGLLALGLAPPRHVAMFAENRSEWAIAQIAVGLIRGVALGCYPTSSPEDLRHALGHADVQVLFCQDAAFLQKAQAVLPDLKGLQRVVLMQGPAEGQDALTMAELEARGAAALRETPGLLDAHLAAQSLGDVGLMVYTSGSTGAPKAAMLSYRNMRAQAQAFGRRLNYAPGGVVLCYLPMCHIAEQAMSIFTPLYHRTAVAYGGGLPDLVDDLRAIRPTYFSGVPRVWLRLQSEIVQAFEASGRGEALKAALQAGAAVACKPEAEWTAADRAAVAGHAAVAGEARRLVGLDRAGVATSGAASLAVETLTFFRALGFPLLELLGQTEACSIITLQRPDKVVPGTVGEPIAGLELKLAPDDEILVRGENVFVGYYKNPEATAAALEGGWLHTGDVGRIEDGQVRIVDRKKDIMITDGGKNIAPAEIEALMRSSDLIQECVLVAEGRKYVSALIQVAPAAVAPGASYEAVAADPATEGKVAAEIRRLNAALARVAQIKRAYILPAPLRHDLGDLTPTLKLRRFMVHQRHAEEMEAIYAGRLGFDVYPEMRRA